MTENIQKISEKYGAPKSNDQREYLLIIISNIIKTFLQMPEIYKKFVVTGQIVQLNIYEMCQIQNKCISEMILDYDTIAKEYTNNKFLVEDVCSYIGNPLSKYVKYVIKVFEETTYIVTTIKNSSYIYNSYLNQKVLLCSLPDNNRPMFEYFVKLLNVVANSYNYDYKGSQYETYMLTEIIENVKKQFGNIGFLFAESDLNTIIKGFISYLQLIRKFMKEYYIEKTGNKNVTIIPNFIPKFFATPAPIIFVLEPTKVVMPPSMPA